MGLTPPSAFLARVWYAFYVQAEVPPCLEVKDGSKGTLDACSIFSKVLLERGFSWHTFGDGIPMTRRKTPT